LLRYYYSFCILVRNRCYHDSRNVHAWRYPTTVRVEGGPYIPPDDIYCILDMDEGYMAYATESQFLGVAFRGLKGKKLYPIVSSVWGHCEVTMAYIGGLDPEPRQLMDTCRQTILAQLGKDPINGIWGLPLPPTMKKFLMYK
jgi:hypothetical protein